MQSIVQCIGFSVLGCFFFLFNFVVVFGSPLFFWFGLYCLPFATATTSSLVLEIWNPLQSQKWIKVREREKEWLGEGENERKSERGENEWEFEWPIYMCNSFNMPLSAPQFILSIDESIQWETIDNSPPRATHTHTHTYRFPIKIDFGYSFYGLLVIVIHRMSIFALLSTMHARMR